MIHDAVCDFVDDGKVVVAFHDDADKQCPILVYSLMFAPKDADQLRADGSGETRQETFEK